MHLGLWGAPCVRVVTDDCLADGLFLSFTLVVPLYILPSIECYSRFFFFPRPILWPFLLAAFLLSLPLLPPPPSPPQPISPFLSEEQFSSAS